MNKCMNEYVTTPCTEENSCYWMRNNRYGFKLKHRGPALGTVGPMFGTAPGSRPGFVLVGGNKQTLKSDIHHRTDKNQKT